jgi:hypothetical protein
MIGRLRAFLELISCFMGRLWLTVLYFTVVLPFGIAARCALLPLPAPRWHGARAKSATAIWRKRGSSSERCTFCEPEAIITMVRQRC